MQRWTVSVILAAVVGGGLLLATFHQPAARPANQLQPAEAPRDPDAFDSAEKAMKAMGHDGVGFSFAHWQGSSCDWNTYLVDPSSLDADQFFFVKSLATDEMRFLTESDVAEAMKQHVTYDGTFVGGTKPDENGDVYYSLGSIRRDGLPVFVYVRFDEHACGLNVAGVWYSGPRVNEKVKLNLQLLP